MHAHLAFVCDADACTIMGVINYFDRAHKHTQSLARFVRALVHHHHEANCKLLMPLLRQRHRLQLRRLVLGATFYYG